MFFFLPPCPISCYFSPSLSLQRNSHLFIKNSWYVCIHVFYVYVYAYCCYARWCVIILMRYFVLYFFYRCECNTNVYFCYCSNRSSVMCVFFQKNVFCVRVEALCDTVDVNFFSIAAKQTFLFIYFLWFPLIQRGRCNLSLLYYYHY